MFSAQQKYREEKIGNAFSNSNTKDTLFCCYNDEHEPQVVPFQVDFLSFSLL